MCGVISLDIELNLGWGPSVSAGPYNMQLTIGSAGSRRLPGGGVPGRGRRKGLARGRLRREESRKIGVWFGVKFSVAKMTSKFYKGTFHLFGTCGVSTSLRLPAYPLTPHLGLPEPRSHHLLTHFLQEGQCVDVPRQLVER